VSVFNPVLNMVIRNAVTWNKMLVICGKTDHRCVLTMSEPRKHLFCNVFLWRNLNNWTLTIKLLTFFKGLIAWLIPSLPFRWNYWVCRHGVSQSVGWSNARFVGCHYTTRSGAPTVVSYKRDQKVHSWFTALHVLCDACV